MKRSTMILGIALAAGLVPPVSSAAEAHICTTRAFSSVAPMNDAKYKYLPLDDATIFKCPAAIGDKTIPQLAAAGWRVDMPVELPAGPLHAAIPSPPLFTWKLLIHKP